MVSWLNNRRKVMERGELCLQPCNLGKEWAEIIETIDK
jgi:hypothetical protein